MEKFFTILKVQTQNFASLLLNALIFVFPFFFLNLTQEFFIANKFYLLGFGALLLLLISTVQFLITKKLVWEKASLDLPLIVFPITLGISVLLMSPNKIQALLNPNFGLVMMVSLTILYFYLSRSQSNVRVLRAKPLQILSVGSLLLSIITIVFFFQPFKNVNLPQFLAFLKSPGFTPVGSQLDLAVFLGFFVVLGIVSFPRRWESRPKWIPVFTGMTKKLILNSSFLILNLLALFLTVYSLLARRLVPQSFSGGGSLGEGGSLLPPFRLSWYAALEVLKTPSSALMGIGLDNFSSIFTRVKDLAYNQSSLWQINAFNVSRSAVLQIFTETGIFGLLSFGLLVFSVFKLLITKSKIGVTLPTGRQVNHAPTFIYIIICLFIFPTSLIIWFLFFVTLGLTLPAGRQVNQTPTDVQTQNFASLPFPIYLGTAIVSFLLIASSGYFLARSYASEYYFKKSLDGISQNNIKILYDNQRQTVIINPYIERYRINFSQTNLLVANNIASKAQIPKTNSTDSTSSTNSNQLSEQDRQTISKAIQAAIAEAKAAAFLNPQKAGNWENLANIYRNIINIAQGSDAWTISAYQRAIVLDPQNPIYRLNLGGVFYSLKNYDEALSLFNQTVALKSDWANGYYNLAWAAYQKKNYQLAVNAMKNAINLLDPKTSKADVGRAQKELEEFKKMLSKQEKETNSEAK